MYPTVVILMVKTQRSVTGVREINPSNVRTTSPAVWLMDPNTTNDQAESLRLRVLRSQLQGGQELAWEGVSGHSQSTRE